MARLFSYSVIRQVAIFVFAGISILLTCDSVSAQPGSVIHSGYDLGTPAQSKGGLAGISTYSQDRVETVNLANGNLAINIPLAVAGGRGGSSYTIALSYNSKLWTGESQVELNIPSYLVHRVASYDLGLGTRPNIIGLGSGWFISKGPALKVRVVSIDPVLNDPGASMGYKYALTRVWLVLPDGSEVELRDDLTEGAPSLTPVEPDGFHPAVDTADRGRVWHSTDGSAISYVTDADNGVVNGLFEGWVYMADGTRLKMSAGSPGVVSRCRKIIDRNGNALDITYDKFFNTTISGAVTYTDQSGRQVAVQDGVGGATVTIKGYNGVPDRTITVDTGPIAPDNNTQPAPNLRSDYQNTSLWPRPFVNGDYWHVTGTHSLQQPHTDLFWNQSSGIGSALAAMVGMDSYTAVTKVNLLDGRKFIFRYNPWGEVAEIIYPGGGVSQIEYESNGNGVCEGGLDLVPLLNRRVMERKVLFDGTNVDAVWSYQRVDTTPYPYVQVEARQGSSGGALLMSEKRYFLALDAEYRRCEPLGGGATGTGYEYWENGKEVKVERQTGSGLQVEQRIWQQRQNVVWPGNPYANDPFHGQENPPNDTRVTREESILENNRLRRADYTYSNDKFNNITLIKEYDFGTNPNAGALLRQTERTYATNINGYCYTNLNGLSGSCSNGVSTDPNQIIHMRRMVLSETIKDGSGNIEAHAEFEYDNYTADGDHAPVVINAGMIGYNGNRFVPFISQFEPRGNVTRVRKLISGPVSGGSYVTAFGQYDNAGNVVKTKDPRGFITTASYADNYGNGSNPDAGTVGPNGATFALVTAVTNHLGHVAKMQWDYTRSAPTGVKDANGVIAKNEYDILDRVVRVTAALGQAEQTVTETSYPTATANETRTSSQLDATRWLSTKTVLDGFGRPTLTSQSEDGLHYSSANFTIHTRAVYDGLGRAVKATNPYRGSGGATTDGWSRTAFDLAGRVVEVATFSGGPGQEPPPYPQTNSNWTGSVVSTYNGEVTTVRDQANKQRRSTVDALGRLKIVDELHENGSLYAATSYTYDARSNLKTVTQGAQNRNFSYDALSRLTSAFNPESGNIGYTYDANSNLKTRTDARIPAVVTTYNYDPLNRVTTRTYSDGTPTVNYVYDTATRGVGRLASVGAVGVSTTNYTEYDRLGRIIQYNQVTDGQPYFMGCAYNKAGLMTSETYPSTKVVVSEYDGAGRLAGVKQQATGLFYAGAASGDATNRMQYTAHGAVSQMKLGNGLWEHTFFNSRLQPTQIGLGVNSASTSVLGLDYTYGTTNNNGNILTQAITAPGLNVTQTYTYDHLNRLKTASESGSGWQQTYDYDRYGNRAVLAGSHIPTPALTPQSLSNFNTSNNKITLTGFNYDGAGNLTSDATTAANAMEYDGENRQERYTKGGATTFYEYDGDGRRVKKEDGTNITIFVYNAGGQLVAEYATNAATGPMTTSYLTTDHLGSTRVVTKQDQSVKSRRDYLPFGEELGAGIGSRTTGMGYSQADGIRQQFTGYERDDESDLDFAQARYYSSAQGRFTSVDPIQLTPERMIDPQPFNLYSYVRNNPIIYIDPAGDDLRVYEYDNDGNPTYLYTVGDARDLVRLGYSIYESNSDGTLLYAQKGKKLFAAQFVPGDEGPKVEAAWNISPIADGVFALLDLSANASNKLIVSFAVFSLNGYAIGSAGGGLMFWESAALTLTLLKEWQQQHQDMAVAGTINTTGGELTPDQALKFGEKWLGPNYKEISPGVFRSADNTRQFRMTSADLMDPKQGPHVHFESIGPNGRTITENNHVKIK